MPDQPTRANVPLSVFPRHPRLVFRPDDAPGLGRTFEQTRKLYESDATFKAIFDRGLELDVSQQHAAALAAQWIVTRDDRYAEAAIGKLLSDSIDRTGSYYSQVWIYALAYDWLYNHPAMTTEKRGRIAAKLVERVGTELDGLDQNVMALWHGRNQAANNTMIAALAIADLPGQESQLRRAAAHYLGALRALQFSEGWPEGPSYWIYNRAGPYALAADCVMTALGTDHIDGIAIRDVMRKIGLWQIYQFTPAGFFEPYGDSDGSLRLGETGWWELTADHFAKLSRDPALMAGADYLRNRSPRPYGVRPYYWNVVITYDPAVRPKNDYDPSRPELWMRAHLPQAMLFGRHSIGVAFFRSQWGDPDELYLSFKAGDLLAHHDHYDVGTFTIQRGGLLAPQTGLYRGPDGYFGAHRLGYSIQSVSANTLLVLAPGETSAWLRQHKNASWTALSGGQRVIRPTSFECVDLAHFRKQLHDGPHLKRADITAFESVPGDYDYVAADITAAYNSTRYSEQGSTAKVSLVTRQFVFLRRLDTAVLYDRIETTNERFVPKFLLHHLSKPQTSAERLLAGNGPEDGILETHDRVLSTSHLRGRLTHHVVLPEEARTLKIGGPNYYAYVEADGDQADGFDGVNLGAGDPTKPRGAVQLGLWRTEVEPLRPSKRARFLNVLLPRLATDGAPLPRVEPLGAGADAHAVRVGDTVLVFARSNGPLHRFPIHAPGLRCLVFNAAPGGAYGLAGRRIVAGKEGVLSVPELPETPCEIRLLGR